MRKKVIVNGFCGSEYYLYTCVLCTHTHIWEKYNKKPLKLWLWQVAWVRHALEKKSEVFIIDAKIWMLQLCRTVLWKQRKSVDKIKLDELRWVIEQRSYKQNGAKLPDDWTEIKPFCLIMLFLVCSVFFLHCNSHTSFCVVFYWFLHVNFTCKNATTRSVPITIR